MSEDALRAATSLERAMVDLGGQFAALRTFGRHNRRMIWALAASVGLDLVLSVVLGVVAVQANHASARATAATSNVAQAARSQQLTCQSGNEARAVTRQLWTFVLDAAAKTADQQAPAKQKQLKAFRRYIVTSFADRDCAAVDK